VHPRIEAILATRGVVTVAAYPRLESSLRRLTRERVLDNPLPGVFAPAGDQSHVAWLRAVTAWSAPDGVLHGRSAASLWLPELAGPVAFVAHPTLRARHRVVVSRHLVPPEFVRATAGLRVASPDYAAVELAGVDDGRALCEALRLRLVDQPAIAAALDAFTGTPGNALRRRAVAACAHRPWSYAELRLHRILLEAGITGWVANSKLVIDDVRLYPDVRFRARLLVLEFDGRATHGSPEQFLADRERWNLLEAAGYHVLRFGWEHLDQPEYVATMVRRAFVAAPPAR
jgi:very-short-patch-repair endonuclease